MSANMWLWAAIAAGALVLVPGVPLGLLTEGVLLNVVFSLRRTGAPLMRT